VLIQRKYGGNRNILNIVVGRKKGMGVVEVKNMENNRISEKTMCDVW
jgi:hypothetical protein